MKMCWVPSASTHGGGRRAHSVVTNSRHPPTQTAARCLRLYLSINVLYTRPASLSIFFYSLFQSTLFLALFLLLLFMPADAITKVRGLYIYVYTDGCITRRSAGEIIILWNSLTILSNHVILYILTLLWSHRKAKSEFFF
jgi:hypothetical protein